MSADLLWGKIISSLKEKSTEIATVPSNNKKPLWFNAYYENENIYVQNSMINNPSTKMSQTRKISKKDFETVYPYYIRWAKGETYLRQEVRELSRNTAYIFALIAYFE
jgi:hypothetical protein